LLKRWPVLNPQKYGSHYFPQETEDRKRERRNGCPRHRAVIDKMSAKVQPPPSNLISETNVHYNIKLFVEFFVKLV